jgi:hypothetical protein
MLATERAPRVRKRTWKVENVAQEAPKNKKMVYFREGTIYAEPIEVGNNRAGYWGVTCNQALDCLPYDAKIRQGNGWLHLGSFATAWEAGRFSATYKAHPDALIISDAAAINVQVQVHPDEADEDVSVLRPLVLDFDEALPQDELDLGERKGPWTSEEDDLLRQAVAFIGAKKWSLISKYMKGRIGKQCRERWHNHLNPGINKDAWTLEEDKCIWESVQRHGKKWAVIALELAGRTDNQIKNRYNSSLRPKKGYERKPKHDRPHWTYREVKALKKAVPKKTPLENVDWEKVSEKVPQRNAGACRTRYVRVVEAQRVKPTPLRVTAVPIDVPIEVPIEPPVVDNGVDLMAYEAYDEAWRAPTWTQSYRLRWGNGAPVHFKFPPPVVPMWVRQVVPKVETQEKVTKRFLAQKRREATRAEKAEEMVKTLFA